MVLFSVPMLPAKVEALCRAAFVRIGTNVGLKPSEKKVLSAIIENSDDSAVKIAEKTGISKRTVERALVKLQELGMIERIGSKRDGRWMLIR